MYPIFWRLALSARQKDHEGHLQPYDSRILKLFTVKDNYTKVPVLGAGPNSRLKKPGRVLGSTQGRIQEPARVRDQEKFIREGL